MFFGNLVFPEKELPSALYCQRRRKFTFKNPSSAGKEGVRA